jgi:hypothetical protein
MCELRTGRFKALPPHWSWVWFVPDQGVARKIERNHEVRQAVGCIREIPRVPGFQASAEKQGNLSFSFLRPMLKSASGLAVPHSLVSGFFPPHNAMMLTTGWRKT